jgi:hypothetical protein
VNQVLIVREAVAELARHGMPGQLPTRTGRIQSRLLLNTIADFKPVCDVEPAPHSATMNYSAANYLAPFNVAIESRAILNGIPSDHGTYYFLLRRSVQPMRVMSLAQVASTVDSLGQ